MRGVRIIIYKTLTVVTGELDARGSRKQTVAAFPPTHARRLQKSRAEIVVERIVARTVLPFQGNALEAIDTGV